jgi:hypothetical protein
MHFDNLFSYSMNFTYALLSLQRRRTRYCCFSATVIVLFYIVASDRPGAPEGGGQGEVGGEQKAVEAADDLCPTSSL